MNNKRIKKSLVKTIYYSFIIIIGGIIILTLLSALGFPKFFRIFTVETGSMEPNVKKGSLVVVVPRNDYSINSIITFKNYLNPSNLTEYFITHRLVNKVIDNGETKYETKGDANQNSDQLLVEKNKVIGEVLVSVPYLGMPISFAKSKIGFVLLIIIPAMIIVGKEIGNMQEEISNMLNKKKTKNDSRLNTIAPIILAGFNIILISSLYSISSFTHMETITNNKVTAGTWNYTPSIVFLQPMSIETGNNNEDSIIPPSYNEEPTPPVSPIPEVTSSPKTTSSGMITLME